MIRYCRASSKDSVSQIDDIIYEHFDHDHHGYLDEYYVAKLDQTVIAVGRMSFRGLIDNVSAYSLEYVVVAEPFADSKVALKLGRFMVRSAMSDTGKVRIECLVSADNLMSFWRKVLRHEQYNVSSICKHLRHGLGMVECPDCLAVKTWHRLPKNLKGCTHVIACWKNGLIPPAALN